jgi:hypothetical protein
MQYNGMRKKVAEEYIATMKDLNWIEIGDYITWIAED